MTATLRARMKLGCVLLGLVTILGCSSSAGDQAAPDTGLPHTDVDPFETCQLAALAAQCPPGSRPLFGEDAASRCRLAQSGDGGYESGFDAGLCNGQGACLVACNFENPCTCGVDRITNEGVFCTSCAESSACGNAVCEAGESPTTCAVDCAPVCENDTQRCNDGDVETCFQGRWVTETCQAGAACFYFERQERAWCAPRAAVFEEGLPTLAAALLAPVDWRGRSHPHGRVRCGVPDEGCFWMHFLGSGDAALVKADWGAGSQRTGYFTRLNLDTLTYQTIPEAPLDVLSLRGAACPSDGRTPARQPTAYRDPETGRATPLSPFVDDTVPLTCHSVSYRPDLGRVYASLLLDERFLLLGIWDLNTGDFLRALRFNDPERPPLELSEIWVSEDGQLVLQAFQTTGGLQRATVNILWKPESGSYAGLLEGAVADVERGGPRVLLSSGAVVDLEAGTSWERPRGQRVYGFTPDGRYAWGVSADVHGRSLLTLYTIDDGRVFFRYPMPLANSTPTNAGAVARFSPNGRWLVLEGALYGEAPEE